MNDWTEKDERAWAELNRRRRLAHEQRERKLNEIADQIRHSLLKDLQIADILKANALQLVEALEPYADEQRPKVAEHPWATLNAVPRPVPPTAQPATPRAPRSTT